MSELQFDQAGPSKAACQSCHAPIQQEYFTSAGAVICSTCHGALSRGPQLSGLAAFLRASLFGVLTALASALVAFAISYLTGYELAIVWIFLGAFIGALVYKGSESRGGWGYSLLAVSLTYAAIGLSLTLLVATELRRDRSQEPGRSPSGFMALVPGGLVNSPSPSPAEATPSPTPVSKASTASPTPRRPAATTSPGSPSPAAPGEAPAEEKTVASGQTTSALGMGLGLGLAAGLMVLLLLVGILVMPVLVCMSSPISILIYGFGLHAAWKACAHKPPDLAGPFLLASAPTTEPSPCADSA